MTAPPPTRPSSGDALGLVDRVLGYVNSPFRLIAIVVLVVVVIVGYTAWERRADIAEGILHHTISPRLEVGQFATVVKSLANNTGADVVILMSVQLTNNVSRVVAGYQRGNPDWQPTGTARAIFIGNEPSRIAELIEGATVCFNISGANGSSVTRDMAAIGITRACVVSVPPVPDVLVGALGIGWKKPPDPHEEAGAKAEERRAAQLLATW
jgi:hypothetical protein